MVQVPVIMRPRGLHLPSQNPQPQGTKGGTLIRDLRVSLGVIWGLLNKVCVCVYVYIYIEFSRDETRDLIRDLRGLFRGYLGI